MSADPFEHDPHALATPEEQEQRNAAKIDSRRAERKALGVFAVAALLAIIWVIKPVGIGILLGMLFAFTLQPSYEKLVGRHGRHGLIALGCVLASTVALLATFGGLMWLFITRGSVMAQALIASLGPNGGLRAFGMRIASRPGLLHVDLDDISSKLRDAAADLASRAAAIAAAIAATTFNILLMLFFAMMTLSFVLRHWKEITVLSEEMMPIRPRHTRAILEEFQRVGRTTLLGTVVTGLAQGAFAAIGYWITGVPEPAFFGAVTALMSLVPGVGTLIVWVPAGIFLLATGHPGLGVLELVWGGLVVVGASDYIIRPRLVGGHGTMPPLFTFAALFGGVEVFGLAGLIIGPLIMAVSFAILRIFAQDAEERRALGERHA